MTTKTGFSLKIVLEFESLRAKTVEAYSYMVDCQQSCFHHDPTHNNDVFFFAAAVMLLEKPESTPNELEDLYHSCMCHSFDRRETVGLAVFRSRIRRYLDLAKVNDVDRCELITEAVLEHGGFNKPNGSWILTCLTEGDKIANAGLSVVIRSGQCFNTLPPFEGEYLRKMNPKGTYKSPKSSLDDIRACLEWGDPKNKKVGMQTETGLALIKPRLAILKRFINNLASQQELSSMER